MDAYERRSGQPKSSVLPADRRTLTAGIGTAFAPFLAKGITTKELERSIIAMSHQPSDLPKNPLGDLDDVDSSEEWTGREHTASTLEAEALRLLDKAGSLELAIHALEQAEQHRNETNG